MSAEERIKIDGVYYVPLSRYEKVVQDAGEMAICLNNNWFTEHERVVGEYTARVEEQEAQIIRLWTDYERQRGLLQAIRAHAHRLPPDLEERVQAEARQPVLQYVFRSPEGDDLGGGMCASCGRRAGVKHDDTGAHCMACGGDPEGGPGTFAELLAEKQRDDAKVDRAMAECINTAQARPAQAAADPTSRGIELLEATWARFIWEHLKNEGWPRDAMEAALAPLGEGWSTPVMQDVERYLAEHGRPAAVEVGKAVCQATDESESFGYRGVDDE